MDLGKSKLVLGKQGDPASVKRGSPVSNSFCQTLALLGKGKCESNQIKSKQKREEEERCGPRPSPSHHSLILILVVKVSLLKVIALFRGLRRGGRNLLQGPTTREGVPAMTAATNANGNPDGKIGLGSRG